MQASVYSESVTPVPNLRLITRHTNPVFKKIVTQDREMEKVFRVVEKVAATSSTVLILGESGTGKELIARAIHDLSQSTGAFVPVNCGAIPSELLESELFGYEKGAFTGATNSKAGRFVLASNGTIFLDEIGEMSPQLQVKLLRVLQERVVEPLGSTSSKAVNVRVIAATNVDLKKKVASGQFREDLYYRLLVVPVELPPLRERESDIEILAKHFSSKCADELGGKRLEFSPEVLDVFSSYPWPGNLREFENLIARLCILTDGSFVELEDLPAHLTEHLPDSSPCVLLEESLVPEVTATGVDFNQLVEGFENSLIRRALELSSGNKKHAARILNLNRTTLVEKIKKKHLEFVTIEED